MEEVVVVGAMNEPVRGSVDVGALRVERSFAQGLSILLSAVLLKNTTSHRFKSISLGHTTTSKNLS
jgi:hypothetical protein